MLQYDICPDIIFQRSALSETPVDMLVIAAHPDDAELSCGGVVAQMTAEGRRVAIVECTQGEMASRGNVELRRQEAVYAARILNLCERWNLHIPDGNIADSAMNVAKIVAALRYFRPNILLFPPEFDRHPDHESLHRLVRKAYFHSGLTKLEIIVFGKALEPYRPKRLFCYMQTYEFEPDFYVDVSAHFDTKLQAYFAHASQVYVPGAVQSRDEPQTFISSPEFLEFIKARARHFGGKIGVEYAEGLYSVEPLGFATLSALLR
ncbi:MAG: bacillithiol biosynthesis deacetylase BshB1 [Bacteroidota bacterium]|nr:bacillithiol biosynthesis deacetylase BshB1 [Candidatus Kapabacteria bacterium]MDW8220284.1 bacillithiol biosynthesis deacetylase BshB1 [Bacteroidota bacterium]